MNRTYRRAWGLLGQPSMGGGEKTSVITPAFREFGIFGNMPDCVGGISADMALGDKFYIRSGFTEGKPVDVPPEQLKEVPRRRNSF
jgi:hypothetical protein